MRDKEYENPNVDYDHDQYGNRIRKYVKVGYDRAAKAHIWGEDVNFIPERGIDSARLRRTVKKGV